MKTKTRQEMIDSFDVDEWQKAYYKAGTHKFTDTETEIKERIKDLKRWNCEEGHINFLMSLAVIFKHEKKKIEHIEVVPYTLVFNGELLKLRNKLKGDSQ